MKSFQLYFFLVLYILTCTFSLAQTDSIELVKYTPDFKFDEGIYLSFEHAKDNNPIPVSRIISSLDIDDHNFFDKIFEEDQIVLFDINGMKKVIEKSDVWGYCKLGALYIQYHNDFYRIPVVGSISHFVANELVENYRGYDPLYRQYDPYYYDYHRNRYTTVSKELRQYLLDFSTGQILDYNRAGLKVMLMHDPELYEEYNELSKRKQKKLIFFFLRRFNERNPLMIPVHHSDISK